MKHSGLATLVLAFYAMACGGEPVTPAPTCSLPTDNPVVVAMDAGWDVTLAVMSDGSLWCWGNDFEGQCNSGFLGYPVPIVEGECLTTIASSNTAATSVLESGAARLWWLDSDIDLPDPTLTNRELLGTIVQTEAYSGSAALLNDQGVVFLLGRAGDFIGGRDFDDFEVADLPVEVDKLAPGLSPCLLGVDGVAYCLEVDENGVPHDGYEQGTDVSSFKPLSVPEPVQSFSVGTEQACCALAGSGAVYCVGRYVTPLLPTGEPTTTFELVDGLPPLEVLKLSEGGATACGLSNGQLWCWGANEYAVYQPEDSDVVAPVQTGEFDNVVDFAVGDFHLCALLDNHEVWCRGYYGAKGLCSVETDWEKLTFEYCNAFD